MASQVELQTTQSVSHAIGMRQLSFMFGATFVRRKWRVKQECEVGRGLPGERRPRMLSGLPAACRQHPLTQAARSRTFGAISWSRQAAETHRLAACAPRN